MIDPFQVRPEVATLACPFPSVRAVPPSPWARIYVLTYTHYRRDPAVKLKWVRSQPARAEVPLLPL